MTTTAHRPAARHQDTSAVIEAARTAAAGHDDIVEKFWLDDAFWAIERNDCRANYRARRKARYFRFFMLGRD